jgi:hypothetical protein
MSKQSEERQTERRISPLLAIAIILALLAIGAFAGSRILGGPSENSPYSAVYLTTGDIYFGKLSWFPKPRLESPLLLDRSGEQPKVVVFQEAFWGPGQYMYLNADTIVFWTKLRQDSPIVEALQRSR